MKKTFFAILSASVLTTAASAQTTIFEDDFESYADTPAFDASAAWTANDVTISTTEFLSGSQSLEDAGSGAATGGHTAVPAVDVTPSNPLVVSFQLLDDDSINPQRKGLSYGGYDGGAFGAGSLENFVALGVYTTQDAGFYNHRAVFGGGGWQTGSVARTTGWHEMVITLDGTNVTFEVDGVETGTDTYSAPPSGYNSYRLGSFVGAADSTTNYDDFSIVLGTAPADVQDWHLY